MKKLIALCGLCTIILTTGAQSIKIISSDKKTSLRGLSVVSDQIIWASGTGGTVARSIDGGETWKWMSVKGFEKTDFRDIEAFDGMTALIMGIASPAYILRTVNGGDTWRVVFENKEKGMFLDAMEFWNEQAGIVIGDPIDNKFFIIRTFDGGSSWQGIPPRNYPVADSGEACFASSGTNIRKLDNASAVFVSGGLHSRMFIRDKRIELPILQGSESTGANSVAVKNRKNLIVVGGDFNNKDASDKNCVITSDGGKSFSVPQNPPHGYRSCIEYIGKDQWICSGLNGVDYSRDSGKNWKWVSKVSFHVCRKAKKGSAVFFAGNNGNIGKLIMGNN